MGLSSLEVIVTIFAVLGIVKILFLAMSKDKWWEFAKRFYGNPDVNGIITLILAAVVLYFMLNHITIVELMGAAVFVSLLMAFGFMQYSDEFLQFGKKIFNKKMETWTWFYIVIWGALLIWALWEIFF